MDHWPIFVQNARRSILEHQKIFAKRTLLLLPHEPIAAIASFLSARDALALGETCRTLQESTSHDMIWDAFMARDFDATSRVRGRFGSSLEPGSSRASYFDRARMHIGRRAREQRGFTLCELPIMLRHVTVYLFPAPAFFLTVFGTLVTLTLWLDGFLLTRDATEAAPWVLSQLLAALFASLVLVACLASCGITPLAGVTRGVARRFDIALALPHLMRFTYDVLPLPLPLEHIQRKWRMRVARIPAEALPILALTAQVALLTLRYLLRDVSEAAAHDERAIRLQLAPGMETVTFPLRWLLGVTVSMPAFLLYWPLVIYAVFIGPLLPSTWTTPHESNTVPEADRESGRRAIARMTTRCLAIAPIVAYIVRAIIQHGALFAVEVTPAQSSAQEIIALSEALGIRNASAYLATLDSVVTAVGSALSNSTLLVGNASAAHGNAASHTQARPVRGPVTLPSIDWLMFSNVGVLCMIVLAWLLHMHPRSSTSVRRICRIVGAVATVIWLLMYGSAFAAATWAFLLACADVVSLKIRRQAWWTYATMQYLISHFYTAGSAALMCLFVMQLQHHWHVSAEEPPARRRRNRWVHILSSGREAQALSMHGPFTVPAIWAMLCTTVLFCARLDMANISVICNIPYLVVMAPLLALLCAMSVLALLCAVQTLYDSLESRERYYWASYGTFVWSVPIWHGLRPARKKNLLE